MSRTVSGTYFFIIFEFQLTGDLNDKTSIMNHESALVSRARKLHIYIRRHHSPFPLTFCRAERLSLIEGPMVVQM